MAHLSLPLRVVVRKIDYIVCLALVRQLSVVAKKILWELRHLYHVKAHKEILNDIIICKIMVNSSWTLGNLNVGVGFDMHRLSEFPDHPLI